MEVEYSSRFLRDVRRVSNATLRRRLTQTIGELESASNIADVLGVARLHSGGGRHYRIRIGTYRLGLTLENNVVVLVRFLHRREVYRGFP